MTRSADKFRLAAMNHGYVLIVDCYPWGEGEAIVHGPTWFGREYRDTTCYTSWEQICYDNDLHPDARENSGTWDLEEEEPAS